MSSSDWDSRLRSWETQQAQAFTAWINSLLPEPGDKIQNVLTDLSDGIKLCKVMETISGRPVRYTQPKLLVHKHENVKNALIRMSEMGMDTEMISSDNVVSGDVTYLLGMIWMMILKFQIESISVGKYNAKDGLLIWCQRELKTYEPEVKIDNFTASWRDGLAFCALLASFLDTEAARSRYKVQLQQYNEEQSDHLGSAAIERFKMCFTEAEQQLGIPQMLDAESMVNRPDEKAVMTYISIWFKKSAAKKANKAAGDTLKHLFGTALVQKRLMNEFNKLADDFLQNAQKCKTYVNERPIFAGKEDTNESLAELTQFDNGETAIRDGIQSIKQLEMELADIVSTLGKLQISLQASQKPNYEPKLEMHPSMLYSELKTIKEGSGKKREYLVLQLEKMNKAEIFLGQNEKLILACRKWIEETANTYLADAVKNTNKYDITAIQSNIMTCKALISQHKTWVDKIDKCFQFDSPEEKIEVQGMEQLKELKAKLQELEAPLQDVLQIMNGYEEALRGLETIISNLSTLIAQSVSDLDGFLQEVNILRNTGTYLTQSFFLFNNDSMNALQTQVEQKQEKGKKASKKAEAVGETKAQDFKQVNSEFDRMMERLTAIKTEAGTYYPKCLSLLETIPEEARGLESVKMITMKNEECVKPNLPMVEARDANVTECINNAQAVLTELQTKLKNNEELKEHINDIRNKMEATCANTRIDANAVIADDSSKLISDTSLVVDGTNKVDDLQETKTRENIDAIREVKDKFSMLIQQDTTELYELIDQLELEAKQKDNLKKTLIPPECNKTMIFLDNKIKVLNEKLTLLTRIRNETNANLAQQGYEEEVRLIARAINELVTDVDAVVLRIPDAEPTSPSEGEAFLAELEEIMNVTKEHSAKLQVVLEQIKALEEKKAAQGEEAEKINEEFKIIFRRYSSVNIEELENKVGELLEELNVRLDVLREQIQGLKDIEIKTENIQKDVLECGKELKYICFTIRNINATYSGKAYNTEALGLWNAVDSQLSNSHLCEKLNEIYSETCQVENLKLMKQINILSYRASEARQFCADKIEALEKHKKLFDENEELVELFNKIDSSKTGLVLVETAHGLLTGLGINTTVEEVAVLADLDGKVSLRKLCEFVSEKHSTECNDRYLQTILSGLSDDGQTITELQLRSLNLDEADMKYLIGLMEPVGQEQRYSFKCLFKK